MTELRHVMGLLTMADEGEGTDEGTDPADAAAGKPRNPAWPSWRRWSDGSGTPGCTSI